MLSRRPNRALVERVERIERKVEELMANQDDIATGLAQLQTDLSTGLDDLQAQVKALGGDPAKTQAALDAIAKMDSQVKSADPGPQKA